MVARGATSMSAAGVDTPFKLGGTCLRMSLLCVLSQAARLPPQLTRFRMSLDARGVPPARRATRHLTRRTALAERRCHAKIECSHSDLGVLVAVGVGEDVFGGVSVGSVVMYCGLLPDGVGVGVSRLADFGLVVRGCAE